MDDMCVVCRRREPDRGRVCGHDLAAMQAMLDDLPRKLRLLPLMLMPGQSPAGEKVATTRVGSPTPARLDTLSLVGPGAVPVPGALHPLVRRRLTMRAVTVEARVGTYRVEHTARLIEDWRQETVVDPATGEPVLVTDDDQTGMLPPAEWLTRQVTLWCRLFGHHRKPVTYVPRGKGPRPPRDAIAWVLQHGTPQQVQAMFAVEQLRRQYAQGVVDLMVGHEPGHGGNRPARLREDDPVADAWELRFGPAGTPRGAAVNIRYLHTWLPAAAERDDLDVARFAAELRSLSAELTRVLGERPDNQWLGRCPATIVDQGGQVRQPCGAGLWQDPHASVVECPRCHAAWGPRTVHLIHLAAEIRRVWPLDRRRRYSAEEIDALKPIVCPGCGGDEIQVGWQEVTAAGDRVRWWRPTKTCCPDGCEQAKAVL